MDNVKIKLSYSGIGQLLRGPEMKQLVEEYGARAAEIAGEGYSYESHNTGQRQAANVFPKTAAAKRDNYKYNTLLITMNLL